MLKSVRGTTALWIIGGAVLALTLGGAVARQPVYAAGAVLALVTIVAAFTPRADRIVGYVGVFSIGVVTLAPVHLVPSAIRFGQLLIFALLGVIVIARRRLPAMHLSIAAMFLVYLAVTFVSTRLDALPGAMFQFVLHAVIGLAFLVIGLAANPDERRMITRFVIGLAAVQAVYAVIEVIALPPVLWASPVPSTFATPFSRLSSEIVPGLLRAQGTFGHPLLLSMFLAVAMALTARYTFTDSRTKIVLTAVFLLGALATGSRSTLLIMVVLILFAYGRQQMSLLRGVLIGAASVALLYLGGFFGSSIVDRFSDSGSVSHRAGALDAVPRLLSQPFEQVLIGNGWYSREYLFDRGFLQLDGFLAVDNQFVSLLVTAGLLGVALFAAIIVASIWVAPAVLRPALFAAFAMYVVFDVNEFPAPWAMLALLLGLASCKCGSRTTEMPMLSGQHQRKSETASLTA